jgi:acetyltransferase-like isoleucine patch superfamily enzyme
MIKVIKRKIKKILFKKSERIPSLDEYIECSTDTVLLNSRKIRFDVKPEKRKYITIGNRGLINATFVFESTLGMIKIGNNVHIGGATFISRNSIEIEDDVTMAWGIVLYDHDSHSIFWEHRKNDNNQCYKDYFEQSENKVVNKDWTYVNTAPIKICSKVWIGFDVLILKGVTIGEGAIVGAKSVVTHDVPAWTVVAGNPARIVKEIPHE